MGRDGVGAEEAVEWRKQIRRRGDGGVAVGWWRRWAEVVIEAAVDEQRQAKEAAEQRQQRWQWFRNQGSILILRIAAVILG